MAEPVAEAAPSPRDNPDLVGHEEAERVLARAFATGRMPHAWMISGPKGVGKATLAYRFARFVLAAGRTGAPGGPDRAGLPPSLALSADDGVFRRVASGGHADLLVVEKSWDERRKRMRDEIVVDDARQLPQFFSLTAAEGGWRVAIIDAADEMNRNAANALLKIVEEPPAFGLVLLIAHAPGGLAPTIRSRCRKLALRPLADDALTAFLGARAPDLSEVERAALTGLAEGSPGRALRIAAAGGMALYEEVVGLLSSLPGLDIGRAHRLGDRLSRRGGEDSLETLAWFLGGWLAKMIRGGAAGEPFTEIVGGERALAERLLARRDLDRWAEVWEKASALLAAAHGANLDRKQAVLNVFSGLDRAVQDGDSPVLPWVTGTAQI